MLSFFVQHVFCIASLSQILFIKYMIIELYSLSSGKFSHLVIKHSPHGDRIMGCPPGSLFQESRNYDWPSWQSLRCLLQGLKFLIFNFPPLLYSPFQQHLTKIITSVMKHFIFQLLGFSQAIVTPGCCSCLLHWIRLLICLLNSYIFCFHHLTERD